LSSIGSVEMVFCGSSSSSAFSSSSPCNLQAVGTGDSKSYVGSDGASARVSTLCKRRRCGGGGVKQPLLSQTFVPANSSPKLSQGLLLKTPNGAPRGHRSTLSGWFRDKFALSRGFVSRMGSCCACFHHGASPSLHLVLCSWKDTSGCVLHCKTLLGLLFLRDFFGRALTMFLAEWINCWELAFRGMWFGFLGYEDVSINLRVLGMKIQWFCCV
jgi:hypothetical protein